MIISFLRNKAVQTFGASDVANSFLRVTSQYRMSRRSSTDMIKGHSKVKTVDHGDFTVTIVPSLSDNFMYLVKPVNSKRAFAIDPVDHKRIAHETIGLGTSLETILCTHHHADHDGGNIPLKRLYPQLEVFGLDERIHGITNQLEKKAVQDLSVCGLDVKVLHTPCHTTGHSTYIVQSSSGEAAVFVGDTLFNAGCGRLFEGTPEELLTTVEHILSSVSDDDKMYFAHEYSASNIRFALSVDPSNEDLKARQKEVSDLREISGNRLKI
ncbi:Oidioi.mRNA.OKI2018_I69.chr2.g4509.t1.cds [Oikopleura dioica]|uniref:hydroxyacylglutathione hydrolase n=1 Tax=Oikopleura dioica TaxID=34765 RepID=A0ABN7SXB0_OIKDI|nr:Oidioi.mRNA.OKI2018_I69.chr2.g4509.t1.cds [Oikopleura dioica]